MPLERLEAEITQLAGNLAAAECRWLLLIAEFDRRAGHEQWGCRTCAHWLSWHCGLDLRAAQERLRIARSLESLPQITAEFSTGKLSYSKVRAITRVATPQNEAELVMLALHATAVQLERAVRAYRSVLTADDETDAANAQHAARYLRYDWADDGSLEGSFRIPPEMAAMFLKGVAAARAHIPAEADNEMRSAERHREVATTNCDALVMMAEALLAIRDSDCSRSDRFQIMIHVDDAVLTGDADGRCELDNGPALAPETVRRIACDASIVHAVYDAVDRLVGTTRKAPAIPASTRRAIRARDRGCRFPGCGGRAFTNIHHIRHRARFGGNELTNLVELCWFHHRLVHEGGWNLRFDDTGAVIAIRPNGNVLARPRPASGHDPHAVERDNRRWGIAIDPTTCIPRWYGDRLDLAEIVSGLVSADETSVKS